MIISTDAEKASENIQHLFMTKYTDIHMLTRNKRNFLNIIKTFMENL